METKTNANAHLLKVLKSDTDQHLVYGKLSHAWTHKSARFVVDLDFIKAARKNSKATQKKNASNGER